MLEAVRYCLMQADAGLTELKKNLKDKRENLELDRQAFEARKREQEAQLEELEKRANREREEVMSSSEVYKGLGKQCTEKSNELEMIKYKIQQA